MSERIQDHRAGREEYFAQRVSRIEPVSEPLVKRRASKYMPSSR